MSTSRSQVISSVPWCCHWTNTRGITLFLRTRSFQSRIWAASSTIVKFSCNSSGCSGITWDASTNHFLNIETWNTLCTPDSSGGKSNLYATSPTLLEIFRTQCSEDSTFPACQTSLSLWLVIPLEKRSPLLRIPKVSASYLHSISAYSVQLSISCESTPLGLHITAWFLDPKVDFRLPRSNNWMLCTVFHTKLRMAPSQCWSDNYYCRQTQSIANAPPNYVSNPKHGLSTCLNSSFGLTNCLRMESGVEIQYSAKSFLQCPPKSRCKPCLCQTRSTQVPCANELSQIHTTLPVVMMEDSPV